MNAEALENLVRIHKLPHEAVDALIMLLGGYFASGGSIFSWRWWVSITVAVTARRLTCGRQCPGEH